MSIFMSNLSLPRDFQQVPLLQYAGDQKKKKKMSLINTSPKTLFVPVLPEQTVSFVWVFH